MTFGLLSNIASLRAQRNLNRTTSSLSQVYERLSSGQRINRASDDAAGLAIAEDLKSKTRIYSQAIRNGNDGISLLNMADSAIESLQSIAVRVKELSAQAANGSYSSVQRAALNAEAQSLSKEFSRIIKTTSFNGVKLFDGSLIQGVDLQVGAGSSDSLKISVGGSAIGTGSFNSSFTYSANSGLSSIYSLITGDLNGDGILDVVATGYGGDDIVVRLGVGDGTFSSSSSYALAGMSTPYGRSLALGDVNGDGILDLAVTTADYPWAGVNILLGNGSGGFSSATNYFMDAGVSSAITSVKLADIDGDGSLDIITGSLNQRISVRLNNGSGVFGAETVYTGYVNGEINSIGLEDINGDGILDLLAAGGNRTSVRLGTGGGSFGSATVYTNIGASSNSLKLADLDGDGNLDMVVGGIGTVTIRKGLGDGTFAAATSFSAPASYLQIGDVNNDGILDLVASAGTVALGKGDGTFSVATSAGGAVINMQLVDLNNDGVLDIIGSNSTNIVVRRANTTTGVAAIAPFSLLTADGALEASENVSRTIDKLALQRGTIGASQSRVNTAISHVEALRENYTMAESRIRDADIAAESAELVRLQILQQAGVAVLAQANQQPALVLKLLSYGKD